MLGWQRKCIFTLVHRLRRTSVVWPGPQSADTRNSFVAPGLLSRGRETRPHCGAIVPPGERSIYGLPECEGLDGHHAAAVQLQAKCLGYSTRKIPSFSEGGGEERPTAEAKTQWQSGGTFSSCPTPTILPPSTSVSKTRFPPEQLLHLISHPSFLFPSFERETTNGCQHLDALLNYSVDFPPHSLRS